MPNKEIISCSEAPAAVGPYSHAVKAGGMVFVSGQLPLDPATGRLVGADIEDQTHCCLKNVSEILKACGLSMDDVVKVSVFLKDLNDFESMNRVYDSHFRRDFPARVCVEVARLPLDVRIEIEAIAHCAD